MAHITFKADEKKHLQELDLPEGTILLQEKSDKYGTLMYRFCIIDGKWVKTDDFIEKNRGWKKGEEEEFSKNMNRERIIDFFLQPEGSTPYREYHTMSNAEVEHFKFCRSAGTYRLDEKSGEERKIFRISLNTDSDLDAAEEEAIFVFTRVAKKYPKWNPIFIDIFEHTLSEYGSYYAYWNRRKTFRLMKCTYGREKEIAKFTGWRNFLEYVSKNHYYEDPTGEYSDDDDNWFSL